LFETILTTARAKGRTPEELVADAFQQYVSDDRWARVLAYGRKQAETLGYSEADVQRLIAETRRTET
jgi:hypothetical protein